MMTRNDIAFLVLLRCVLALPLHGIILGNILSWQGDGFRDSVMFSNPYLV